YIDDSEPIEHGSEEDLKMDPVDYPFDEEEKEPLSLALSASHVPDYVPSSKDTEPFEEGETAPTPPSPPPSPLSPLLSLLPRIPSPPLLLPSPTRRDIILEADMPPQ
ncbi:hypothetical protein Tco_0479897, partial [Tanacetum coccineum]